MREIPLRRKDGSVAAYALIDDEDFDDISQFPWYLGNRGYAMRQIHVRIARGVRTTHAEFMHRRILGLERGDPLQADHINRIKLDNRRSNLRAVTQAQNEQNKTEVRAQSGVRNVHWVKSRNYWKVHMTVEGRQYVREGFHSIEEAAIVAAAMRRELQPFAP